MFLELFTVVAVEYFVHGYNVGGVHAPGPFRLAHWRANDVGHFGEQVERVIGGVLDNPGIELFQRRIANVYGYFSRIGHRRLVQYVIRDEREHGYVNGREKK